MERSVFTILDDISRAFPHRRRAGDLPLISGRPLGCEPWTIADATRRAETMSRWARLSTEQVAAVTHWLEHRASDGTEAACRRIGPGLGSYWSPRLRGAASASDRAPSRSADNPPEPCDCRPPTVAIRAVADPPERRVGRL